MRIIITSALEDGREGSLKQCRGSPEHRAWHTVSPQVIAVPRGCLSLSAQCGQGRRTAGLSGWNREGLEAKKSERAITGRRRPGIEGQRRVPDDSRCGGRAAAIAASPLRAATTHGPPLRQGPPL